jgi:hypothetical protein
MCFSRGWWYVNIANRAFFEKKLPKSLVVWKIIANFAPEINKQQSYGKRINNNKIYRSGIHRWSWMHTTRG